MDMKKAIIPIFLLLIVIVGAFYLYQRSAEKEEVSTENSVEERSKKIEAPKTEKKGVGSAFGFCYE
ncbi:MAG: hypothetical protein D6734_02485 [Candidatus Schekmanbacteria bacterium]|nr:MAG: hypothetical protein D6734_02485 [Candidatus Schekmanbacteria bacterium]